MGFIIYHLARGTRRVLGYLNLSSLYVFYFGNIAFYIFLGFFVIEYLYQIYLLVFAPISGKSSSISALHAYAEILEQEEIIMSVKNLFDTETAHESEIFYPILDTRAHFPQTIPEMMSLYQRYGPRFAPEHPSPALKMVARWKSVL